MNQSELKIWNETQGKLRKLAFNYTKDREIAHDIVQDVYLKLHESLDQLKDPGKLTHWLFRVTRNAITDHFRSLARSIPPEAIDWETSDKKLNECVEHCLNDILETLPAKYRDALELSDVQNLSQIDLSKKLRMSYSGAKSRVQRARQMLRSKMESNYRIKMDSYGNVILCENKVPCNCPDDLFESCK